MRVEARPDWLPRRALAPAGPVSRAFRALGAHDYVEAASLVHRLPYGRPSRPPATLVEQRGTCSPKHGLLAQLAEEQGLQVGLVEVQTTLNPTWGPRVAAVLDALRLSELPELHVHLVWDGRGVDLTFPPDSGRSVLEPAAEARPIDRSALLTKSERHRARMAAFAAQRGRESGALWAAREACIAALADPGAEQVSSGPEATRELRRAILRPHQTIADCVYPGDDASDAVHLVRHETDRVIAVGSALPDPRPEGPDSGWRIRGMATVPSARGRGHGRCILRGLVAGAVLRGATELWCNARVGALGLYERAGFVRASDEFELPGIGPHYLLLRSV